MPFQPAPSIVGTVIDGRMDGQLTNLDLNWFATGAITPANIGTLCGDIGAWVGDVLAPLLSRDWTAFRVRGFDLSVANGAVNESPLSATGGVDVEAAPNNVAACVSLRTGTRGRSGHGRNFVPGIPNSVITLNTLDSGFISDLVAAYFTLAGAGSFSAGFELVVLSRIQGGVPLANAIGLPVTAVTMVGTSVRSMRSREIGHGA